MKAPAARLRVIAMTQLNILQGLVCEAQFSAKDIVAQNIVERFNPLLQRHSIKITDTCNRPSRKCECNSSCAINMREGDFCKKKKERDIDRYTYNCSWIASIVDSDDTSYDRVYLRIITHRFIASVNKFERNEECKNVYMSLWRGKRIHKKNIKMHYAQVSCSRFRCCTPSVAAVQLKKK